MRYYESATDKSGLEAQNGHSWMDKLTCSITALIAFQSSERCLAANRSNLIFLLHFSNVVHTARILCFSMALIRSLYENIKTTILWVEISTHSHFIAIRFQLTQPSDSQVTWRNNVIILARLLNWWFIWHKTGKNNSQCHMLHCKFNTPTPALLLRPT